MSVSTQGACSGVLYVFLEGGPHGGVRAAINWARMVADLRWLFPSLTRSRAFEAKQKQYGH